MNIWLADTSVRQYRRRDGQVSCRLRSYLMIDASGTFRLSAYLRDLSVTLTLRSGESVPFTDVALSENCLYQFGVMVHDLWAGGVIPMEVIRDDVAQLRVDYHINFTGHPYEEPDFFETTIPLLARGSAADQFGRNWRST